MFTRVPEYVKEVSHVGEQLNKDMPLAAVPARKLSRMREQLSMTRLLWTGVRKQVKEVSHVQEHLNKNKPP